MFSETSGLTTAARRSASEDIRHCRAVKTSQKAALFGPTQE
jgi:hypothetical protein